MLTSSQSIWQEICYLILNPYTHCRRFNICILLRDDDFQIDQLIEQCYLRFILPLCNMWCIESVEISSCGSVWCSWLIHLNLILPLWKAYGKSTKGGVELKWNSPITPKYQVTSPSISSPSSDWWTLELQRILLISFYSSRVHFVSLFPSSRWCISYHIASWYPKYSWKFRPYFISPLVITASPSHTFVSLKEEVLSLNFPFKSYTSRFFLTGYVGLI